MIETHLSVLQIILPLIGAPLCALVRRGAAAYAVAVAASWLALAVSWALLGQVQAGGPISYELGGWAPPWGIEYRIDLLNAYVMLIVSAIGAVVITFARPSVRQEMGPHREFLFYAVYLLCLAGLLGVTITGDAFNIFVFLEVSSLSSYILIGLGRDRRALTAAYRYLIFGTIGATFFLIGVGLIYAATGTLNIADMAQRIAPIGDSRTVRAALAFIVVGLLIKSAVFPLHFWLPNAYTYAPSVSTVFLAATATKVSIYVLVRMVFTLFGTELAFTNILVDKLLLVTAVAAMFVGSTVAIFQVNVKRMLAYSSVAQIGYMIVGIGMVSVLGVTGGLLHMFNHALIKGALFLSLGCVVYRTGSVSLDAMAGLGRRMPWTMGAFVVSGLGLIGVPLTAGFVSKWYLILAALERDWWVLAVLIVLSSLLAVIYIWRVVEVAYFRPAPADAPAGEAPLPMLVVTWVLTLASVYFGIHTDISVGVASDAAAFLLGAAR